MIDFKTTGASVAMIAGAVGWIYQNFTGVDDFNRHVAEARTGTVLDLLERLDTVPRGSDSHGLLCRTLVVELTAICTDAPNHPFCEDREMILDDADC
jgi:hypothetical protein